MQPVNLIRVFIASPSDVVPERNAAVQVTHDWNAAHSLSRRIALEAVRMETHAQAALGAHPQQLINGQLLGRCDLLVAIFGARLGSPTPTAISGTIEEISEFSSRKGEANVLLFFADRAPHVDVKAGELLRLRKFKDSIQQKGLYIPFGSLDDFRQKLRQQLEMRMLQFDTAMGISVSHGTPMVALENDGAGTRIDEFRSLRTRARRSMYIMGVGMTLFSTDRSLTQTLLARGFKMRLLMMDPRVLASSRSQQARKGSPDVSMLEGAFDAYFRRKGYATDVRTSLSRLTELEAETLAMFTGSRIELRVYPCFCPMNFTAIDEADADGSVLLEFCLPFSDQRLRMFISGQRDPDLFAHVMEICENLWTMSAPVRS